jgi:hypothetical protein
VAAVPIASQKKNPSVDMGVTEHALKCYGFICSLIIIFCGLFNNNGSNSNGMVSNDGMISE